MEKKEKVKELKQKSRFAAMEGLRSTGGPPVEPRKAIKQARKASKKLSYPIAPYPGVGPLVIYRWAQEEWRQLGKWQGLALPVIILSALLTWEKENALREMRWDEVEKIEVKQMAQNMYLRPEPKRKRKLFGVIPLPGR